MERRTGPTGLAADQNGESALRLLAAQRELHGQAKRLQGVHLLLLGPVPMALALVALFVPPWRWAAALVALCVLVLEGTWLAPGQKRLRESAAKLQERFDCLVLGLGWNTIACGNPEPAETALRYATQYQLREPGLASLRNWYEPEVRWLPLPLARLVCQRSNCWWDAAQRRRYARGLSLLLVAAPLALVATAAAMGASTTSLLVAGGVMAPMLVLCYRQWTEHREAADRLDRLRERADAVWRQALERPDRFRLDQDARALQDEIFDHRKRTPGVFDFIYKRLRSEHELQMNVAARELVNDAMTMLDRRPELAAALRTSATPPGSPDLARAAG